ncbi:MAG: Uma2 family endonuclease, partial [Cyanobacteria bacterium CRU_2_1]|nr:Uma2 family endonuclease [Cyanobacteria bacterium CRU_2_1]
EEGKYPNVIVEILSQTTASVDRGLKKQIYQETFRTPDYYWFEPESLELQGFHLVDGRYQALEANEQGWLWSEQLGLWLGVYESRLRLFTPEGHLLPTPEESAAQERQLKEQAQQRAERLAEKLRELGIDPMDL